MSSAFEEKFLQEILIQNTVPDVQIHSKGLLLEYQRNHFEIALQIDQNTGMEKTGNSV